MIMDSSPLAIKPTDALARTLAERQVDPNEVAKSFAHLRALYEQAGQNKTAQRKAVEDWWHWLAMVSGPGARAVIRSSRTQEYYRQIEDACRYHLREIKDDPELLVHTLGWVVRLMRYYCKVPNALEYSMLASDVLEQAQRTPEREAEPARPPEPPQPKAPELPVEGAIFTGKVLEIDESAMTIEIPDFIPPQTIGIIRAADLAGRKYQKGNTVRVEVIRVRTLKSGNTIIELRPARRRGD